MEPCCQGESSPKRGQAEEEKDCGLTIRQRLAQLLQEDEYTAKELSRILSIREKEVYEHLPHVARSLGGAFTLIGSPARCLSCGFSFAKRQRFTRPGRCPVCKSQQITEPVFNVTEKRAK